MKRGQSVALTLLRISIGLALLFYLWTSGAIRWRSLWGLGSNWRITAAALLLLLVDILLLAWRLCLLLKPAGFHLTLGLSTRLTLVGTLFNTCLPGSTGGDIVKIYYAMEGNRGRRTEVATIVLLDRIVGMFALLILPLLVAPLFPGIIRRNPVLRGLLLGAAAVGLLMFVAGVLCFSSKVRQSRVLSWMFRKLPGGSYGESVFDTLHSYRHWKAGLTGVIGISLITHLLTIGVTLLALRAINPRPMTWDLCLLVPLGHLANTLPLTPGGLGVGETAFRSLFKMAGLRGGAEALLGWRLLTILISLPGIVYYFQGRRRFVHVAEVSTASDPSA